MGDMADECTQQGFEDNAGPVYVRCSGSLLHAHAEWRYDMKEGECPKCIEARRGRR